MTLFLVAIFFLGLSSLATAANLTLVYEWPHVVEWDDEWPFEANRSLDLRDGNINPKIIDPRYMAVYGSRIFLILQTHDDFPVSLVSMPTSSASSESAKLIPFPSRDTHRICDKIEEAKGLELDSVGRLWVLDSGSEKCNSKILAFDLTNNDERKLIHRFRFYGQHLHSLILDETPNGTFAYISRQYEQNIVVFSLERNQSWIVETPGMEVSSIVLSPKDQEPRNVYLGKFYSNELYSIPVATLRNRTRSVNPKQIGKWTATPYRMVMDNHGIIYAAFFSEHYIHSWNTSQPFLEQPFYETNQLIDYWPFTIALDQNGTIWITTLDKKRENPRYRLLKASDVTPVIPATTTERSSLLISTTTSVENTATIDVQECSILAAKLHQCWLFIIFLFCSYVFTVILLTFIILRKNGNNNSLPPNTNEAYQMTIDRDKARYHKFHDSVNSMSPFPELEAVEIFPSNN